MKCNWTTFFEKWALLCADIYVSSHIKKKYIMRAEIGFHSKDEAKTMLC